MRLFWALSAALLLAISLALVVGEPGEARAQEVDEAEEDAERARRRADAAAGILDDEVERRDGIEDDLATSLTRLSEINAELTRVSIRLDGLRQALTTADTDLARLNDDLNIQAVDAYIRAVAVPAAVVVGIGSTETAIVASTSLDSAIGSDQAEMSNLTVKRRELERARREYTIEEEQVAALRREADREAAHLEELLAEADGRLAEAAAAARAADSDYREALNTIDLARARQEERRRQEQRDPTTTTTAPPAVTTTTSGGPTTTTPAPPPVSGGDFPPAVERWRPLATSYFTADRIDEALSVISCESRGDPNAYNPYSGASGLFQFLPSTWATLSPRAGFAGASVFEPEANIGTAAWLTDYFESRGTDPWSAWTCRP
jgi:hypothetical protein